MNLVWELKRFSYNFLFYFLASQKSSSWNCFKLIKVEELFQFEIQKVLYTHVKYDFHLFEPDYSYQFPV